MELAETLRKTNGYKLLQNDSYRSYVAEDQDRLWKQFDELSDGTIQEQKTLLSCTKCHEIWWLPQGDRAGRELCQWGLDRDIEVPHDLVQQPCWLERDVVTKPWSAPGNTGTLSYSPAPLPRPVTPVRRRDSGSYYYR